MKGLSKILVTTVLTGAILMASGCAVYPDEQGGYGRNYGPPPRTANDGYQQSYGGHNVRYDSHLGVYLVVGMPDYYYQNNQYYRYDRNRNRWYHSRDLNKGWRNYDERKLPPGLAKKYSKRDGNHDRNRDRDH